MSDVFLIKGMRETVERILQAVSKKEKIIIFGDADPDGVASVIILKETLEILGNPPFIIYFPNREKDGYGLNRKALAELRDSAPALLITLDCGIGNFVEMELASRMGFEVIIIDHHLILEKLPKATAIIDLKQKEDRYPFKELCTAAIVYKLARVLLYETQSSFNPERFLELSMIATISDQMRPIEENEKIIKEGLLSLRYTKRKGLKALIDVTGFKGFAESEVIDKLIPPLVSANSRDHKNEAYLLLVESSPEKATKIATLLFKKNKIRKQKIREIFEDVIAKINPTLPIVFLGDETWPFAFIGTISSKVCQKYVKPTFIFKIGEDESQGSVRTPKGIDSVQMMAACAQLLETYGGHSQASGFRVKNENLEQFKACLIEHFKK